MSYGFEVYLPVDADVAPLNLDIPSGSDTTSGYYITYEMASEDDGGGFSGISWYFSESGNPLVAAGLKDYESVRSKYDTNGGNLNDVFGAWLTNSGPDAVHDFCHYLWENARSCITMV